VPALSNVSIVPVFITEYKSSESVIDLLWVGHTMCNKHGVCRLRFVAGILSCMQHIHIHDTLLNGLHLCWDIWRVKNSYISIVYRVFTVPLNLKG